MARKKWTAQTEITDSLIRIREKRKWQLAYRRYVLEKMPSDAYAPYFGLDTILLREWFELQFSSGLEWGNFGKAWQFEHILPTTYFDYSNENDLRLCWNFINIRVEKLEEQPGNHRISALAVRPYFQGLYDKTGFSICLKMLEKIARIEVANIESLPGQEDFIIRNKPLLENISGLSQEEFNRFNKGTSVEDILLEREILRKFGSGPNP
jgi:hypothetical protein